MKIIAAYYKPGPPDIEQQAPIPAYRLVMQTEILQHRFVLPQPTFLQLRKSSTQDLNSTSLKLTSDETITKPRTGEVRAEGIVFNSIVNHAHSVITGWATGLLFVSEVALNRTGWSWALPTVQEDPLAANR